MVFAGVMRQTLLMLSQFNTQMRACVIALCRTDAPANKFYLSSSFEPFVYHSSCNLRHAQIEKHPSPPPQEVREGERVAVAVVVVVFPNETSAEFTCATKKLANKLQLRLPPSFNADLFSVFSS